MRYSSLPGEDAVVFLHNFRCAGNALTYILAEEFGPKRIFRYGRLGDEVHRFDDFLFAAKDETVRFFLGHFCFGVHSHIRRPVRYITSMRDPLDRTTSHYAVENSERPSPFRDWFERHFDSRNGMVKRLCGFGYKEGEDTPYDFVNDRPLPKGFEVDEGHLQQALHTLEDRDIPVILQERFVESLCLLRKRFGCRPLFSISRQHFNQFPARPDLDAHREFIEENNALDRKLLDWTRARMDATVTAEGDAFREDVLVMTMLDKLLHAAGNQHMAEEDFFERLKAALELLAGNGQYVLMKAVLDTVVAKTALPRPLFPFLIDVFRRIEQPRISEEYVRLYQSTFDEPFTGGT